MTRLSVQCRAMNRSLTNVIFGGIAQSTTTDDKTKGLSVTRTNVEEVVDMLSGAEQVIIVSSMFDKCMTACQADSRCRAMGWPWQKRNMPLPR